MKILKIINLYHTAARPGMGMWVDKHGRKVSQSFSTFKIGQIEFTSSDDSVFSYSGYTGLGNLRAVAYKL